MRRPSGETIAGPDSSSSGLTSVQQLERTGDTRGIVRHGPTDYTFEATPGGKTDRVGHHAASGRVWSVPSLTPAGLRRLQAYLLAMGVRLPGVR